MEISEKELLQKTADTLLQEPVVLEVDITAKKPLHSFLQKIGWMPIKRRLVINPITLGNLVRISKILLEMDLAGRVDIKNILESNFKLIVENGDRMATVIAIAVHNDRSEPPAALVRFIKTHFTSRETYAAVTVVLKMMDLKSFMNTIISVKGMTVMSPQDQGRSIASGQPSEGL